MSYNYNIRIKYDGEEIGGFEINYKKESLTDDELRKEIMHMISTNFEFEINENYDEYRSLNIKLNDPFPKEKKKKIKIEEPEEEMGFDDSHF